ncbi:MAG: hypothetical protein ACK4WM_09105 [Thermoflexales bacterium]
MHRQVGLLTLALVAGLGAVVALRLSEWALLVLAMMLVAMLPTAVLAVAVVGMVLLRRRPLDEPPRMVEAERTSEATPRWPELPQAEAPPRRFYILGEDGQLHELPPENTTASDGW